MEFWDIVFNSLYAIILVVVIVLLAAIVRFVIQITAVVATINKELASILQLLGGVNKILGSVHDKVKQVNRNPLWDNIFGAGLTVLQLFQSYQASRHNEKSK